MHSFFFFFLFLFQESSKNIQMDAFHVFKVLLKCLTWLFILNFLKKEKETFFPHCLQLFAANQNKPPEIVSILIANRSKLLRFLAEFKMDRGKILILLSRPTDSFFFLGFLGECEFQLLQRMSSLRKTKRRWSKK